MDNHAQVITIDYGNNNSICTGYSLMESKPAQSSSLVKLRSRKSEKPGHDEGSDYALETKDAIEERRIIDFDRFEDVLEDVFYAKLGWVRGDESGVFMVEPLLCSKREREFVCQIMFERFNVNGFLRETSAVCALAACGRLNGISVDVGVDTVDVACVSDGKVVESAQRRASGGGGESVSRALREAIRDDGDGGRLAYEKMEKWERRVVNRRLCRVRLTSFDDDSNEIDGEETYALPDGKTIKVSTKDAYKAGETLFQSSSSSSKNRSNGGSDDDYFIQSIGDSLVSSVDNGFNTTQGHLFATGRDNAFDCIIAHGTESSIRGLRDRITEEVRTKIAPTNAKVNVITSGPDYLPDDCMEYLAWTGGTVLGKVAWNLNQQVTKNDYQEYGPIVCHR